MAAARPISRQNIFKIAEILRHPRAAKIGGAGEGRVPLVFVIKTAGDRVMCVVSLVDKIGDGQLQLVRPQPPSFLAGR